MKKIIIIIVSVLLCGLIVSACASLFIDNGGSSVGNGSGGKTVEKLSTEYFFECDNVVTPLSSYINKTIKIPSSYKRAIENMPVSDNHYSSFAPYNVSINMYGTPVSEFYDLNYSLLYYEIVFVDDDQEKQVCYVVVTRDMLELKNGYYSLPVVTDQINELFYDLYEVEYHIRQINYIRLVGRDIAFKLVGVDSAAQGLPICFHFCSEGSEDENWQRIDNKIVYLTDATEFSFPAVPEVDGYTFDNWYLDRDGSNIYLGDNIQATFFEYARGGYLHIYAIYNPIL